MTGKRSRLRKLLKVAGCGVAGLFAVAVIATLWINWRGATAQRAVFTELEHRGWWPVTQLSPEDSNTHRSYVEAVTILRESADEAEGLPSLGFGDVHFGVMIDSAVADRIKAYVDAHTAFEEHLAAALADPNFSLARSHSPLDEDLTTGLSDIRRAARALELWSIHAQLAGDTDAALDRITDIVRLRQTLHGEPILITHLVALSIDAIAHHTAQDALSRCELSPGAVQRLLDELRHVNPAATYRKALRGEVVYQARGLDRLDEYMDRATREVMEWTATWDANEVGIMIDPRVDPMIGVLPEWAHSRTPFNIWFDARLTRWCYAVWPGIWRTRQAERVRQYLSLYDQVAALDPRQSDFWPQIQTVAAGFTDDEFRGIEASSRSGMVYDATSSIIKVALRVELHRLEQGDWPATLAGAGVDADDPYTGQPLIYKRLPDGVVIYSLGPNGTDEGGVQDGIFVPDRDIAFRLLDPAVRGTLVPSVEEDEWQDDP